MGCVFAKDIDREYSETQRDKGLSRSSRRFVASSRRDDVVVVDPNGLAGNEGSRARLISKERNNVVTSPAGSPDEREKKAVVAVDRVGEGAGHQRPGAVDSRVHGPRIGSMIGGENGSWIASVPNGFVGEHVAAGWPSWLAAVAGEAVKGWLPRKAESFEKFEKIGQGTYSNVYRARDLEKGKTVALKKVRFVNMDPESVRFMAREIHILRRLDHPNVVKLEGLVTSRMSCSLYLVFEYMEHDLAGLAANPSIKFTVPQIKCYMHQLLSGLDHCHNHGVLHRDIKGSNLLIDNNGMLRIADFGLATFFTHGQKQPLTSRVVTLWYRPPELLLGATEYGVSVDLWSAGCILAELFAGKPIMPGRTEVEQLHKIFKLCGSPSEEYWKKSKLPHTTIFKPQHPYRRCIDDTFRDFPSSTLALMNCLLAIEPADRGTAASALESEFFSSKPFACDPSSLPKYPPSKELDAKLRDEEARRQRAASTKGHGSESGRRTSRDHKAVPMPDANAELQESLQKRQVHGNHKSISEKYNPQEENGAVNHSRVITDNSFFHSGPLVHSSILGSSRNKRVDGEVPSVPSRSSSTLRASNGRQLKMQRSLKHQGGGGDLSNLSGLVAARSSASSRYSQLDGAGAS
ncbi:hypothetical protein J5N97_020847 [Dioscorea zingiberensis]|uniref:[RNA-polymerase]-subunit kinase n=1 Tax=Dioscorea zingiberensis TaxID=325984 RepID=A0A9D5HE48_9LILI|nr:hypothetical protein J5N97_020847 [Dioscorea zingiberensis]